jgi:hypothetical protein
LTPWRRGGARQELSATRPPVARYPWSLLPPRCMGRCAGHGRASPGVGRHVAAGERPPGLTEWSVGRIFGGHVSNGTLTALPGTLFSFAALHRPEAIRSSSITVVYWSGCEPGTPNPQYNSGVPPKALVKCPQRRLRPRGGVTVRSLPCAAERTGRRSCRRSLDTRGNRASGSCSYR